MTSQELHIIAFDVPYPPDYGGAMDVFYKVRALQRAGARLHLHCFMYGSRRPAPELDSYCASVHYYPRSRSFIRQLSPAPFIVQSRRNKELEERLLQDPFPILFEGLHTCALISHPLLKDRRRLVRMHNVEWQYYRHLAVMAPHLLHRLYLRIESLKLRLFEPQALRQASTVLAISAADCRYFSARSENPVLLLPAFHGCDRVESVTGTGSFALFHGNLGVSDNERAVFFLLDQVLPGMDLPLVIAGRGPSRRLLERCAGLGEVRLVANPSAEHMQQLMRDAQIHLLYSLQPDGMKLKLLQALHRGRFVVTNRHVNAGTGLEALCRTADTASEIRTAVRELCRQPFPEVLVQERQRLLSAHFSDREGAKLILDLLH